MSETSEKSKVKALGNLSAISATRVWMVTAFQRVLQGVLQKSETVGMEDYVM